MDFFEQDDSNTKYDNFVSPDDILPKDLEQSNAILKSFAETDLTNISNISDLAQVTTGIARAIHNYLLVNHSKNFTGYGGAIPSEVESELDLHPKAFTLSLDVFMPHTSSLKTTHVFEGTTDVLHLDYVSVSRRGGVLNIDVYYDNFESSETPNNETMQIETRNKLIEITLPLNGISTQVLENPKSLFDRDEISIVHTEYRMKGSADEFLTPTRYLNYRSNAVNPILLRDFAESLQKVVYLILNGTPLRLEL